jgi:hypothetical protein
MQFTNEALAVGAVESFLSRSTSGFSIPVYSNISKSDRFVSLG